MSIRASLEIIFDEYPKASQQTFTKNPTARFLREEFPDQIRSLLLGDQRYEVKGSAGQGVWTKVPWLAIFDIAVTESAQEGYYVVFLFKEDFSGVYLSLNQGVTTVKEQYHADAKEALVAKAQDFVAVLGHNIKDLVLGPLDLATNTPQSLGAFYETGNICAVYYDRKSIPGNDKLESDLKRFLYLYRALKVQEISLSTASKKMMKMTLASNS